MNEIISSVTNSPHHQIINATFFNSSNFDHNNLTNLDFFDFSNINESFCTPHSPFQSVYHRTFIYILYAAMFIISVLGNGVVCYIVIATPRMRTVTNYFIANLAIGDMLITLMCVPFTSISQIQQYWPFYNVLCPVSAMAQAVSVFVSAYTLVAISIDRYVAIMWPLQLRLSKKTAAWVIVAVWACACVTVLPLVMVTRAIQPSDYYELCDMYMCMEDWTDLGDDYANYFTRTLLVLQYILPISVLIFTYTSIGVVIWCHRIPGEAENSRDLRIARSKKKMIKMMVAVVLVYTICWLPLNIYLLMHEMGVNFVNEENIWLASHLLAMSHPCYNPVIYCYMNQRFRHGFAQILETVLPCCHGMCSARGLMNNARSQISIPLTSIRGTGSTILHRNNTSITYISSKRRNRGGSHLIDNCTLGDDNMPPKHQNKNLAKIQFKARTTEHSVDKTVLGPTGSNLLPVTDNLREMNEQRCQDKSSSKSSTKPTNFLVEFSPFLNHQKKLITRRGSRMT